LGGHPEEQKAARYFIKTIQTVIDQL